MSFTVKYPTITNNFNGFLFSFLTYRANIAMATTAAIMIAMIIITPTAIPATAEDENLSVTSVVCEGASTFDMLIGRNSL